MLESACRRVLEGVLGTESPSVLLNSLFLFFSLRVKERNCHMFPCEETVYTGWLMRECQLGRKPCFVMNLNGQIASNNDKKLQCGES
jgi:hypothetical protein